VTKLKSALGENAKLGSVDKFQGQKPIVFSAYVQVMRMILHEEWIFCLIKPFKCSEFESTVFSNRGRESKLNE
jgi:hypothetical protein